ncbi:hypothetical protein [Anaerobranca gottschalkii]|uniref:Uncharacterized protein n=1 Tax=Anaerobranca gottschalkii DSM 13577 TaxID=1120990 RepID=A0A1I0B8N1_9FIRM|nr:hypothetical protein [Anaerobranca gottschalkii]SET03227.1 hypothetical protein SAMN03080614_103415 [Anaerobranca gottschalkii DSM 13577]
MMYLEAGGTFSVHFSNDFLTGLAAALGGSITAAAITKYLVLNGGKVALAFAAASAGTGSWLSVIGWAAFSGASVYIGGYIAQRITGALLRGNGITVPIISGRLIPDYTLII